MIGGVTIALIWDQLFYRVVPLIGQFLGIVWLSRSLLMKGKTALPAVVFVQAWQAGAMAKISDETGWKVLRDILLACGLLQILVPSVSYAVAWNFEKRYYKIIYYYLLMGLFIPSQVIMLPVTKMMTKLNMLNHTGLITLYAAFSLTQGVFFCVNYIRGLLYEIEESAQIDGCGTFGRISGVSGYGYPFPG